MPHLYALAAHPLGQQALQLAQEEHRTKGGRAIFAVVLMFGMLCGGVWLLLQSSFGPLQAYLISGAAFFGCWLVLAVLWFTGVPGIGFLNIPESTLRYQGPQGQEDRWKVLGEDTPTLIAQFKIPADEFIEASADISDPGTAAARTAAETAAAEQAPALYATKLGVGKTDITVPGVLVVTKTEIARSGKRLRFARVTYGPATPNDTDSPATRALISRITPLAVDVQFEPGDVGGQTKIAIGLFALLFFAHAIGLAAYEARHVPQPKGAPERQLISA